MYTIYDFTITEIKLLLLIYNIDFKIWDKLNITNTKQLEFIYWEDLLNLLEIEEARKLYAILNKKYLEKPKFKHIFYQPGLNFQKYIKKKTFEERYAKRTFVKTFLNSCRRVSNGNQINICSDITNYILTFIMQKDMGKQIKVRKVNTNINKAKSYNYNLENTCSFGHTHNGPLTCNICKELHLKYNKLCVQIAFLEQKELIYINDYINDKEDIKTLVSMKLDMELNIYKHDFKIKRLQRRLLLRETEFRRC